MVDRAVAIRAEVPAAAKVKVAAPVVDRAEDLVVVQAAAKVVVILVLEQVVLEWAALARVREAGVRSFLHQTILGDLAAEIAHSISTGSLQRVAVHSASTGLRQDTVNHVSGNVGKAKIAALIFVGQLLVV